MTVIALALVFAVAGAYNALSERYMTGLVCLMIGMSIPLLNTL